jgi:hypothetical protein
MAGLYYVRILHFLPIYDSAFYYHMRPSFLPYLILPFPPLSDNLTPVLFSPTPFKVRFFPWFHFVICLLCPIEQRL